MAIKKPRTENRSEPSNQDKANYSILGFISNTVTKLTIGGKMSEQGADKAGLEISEGLKFFLKASGVSVAIALALWLLPDALNGIADFIIKMKSN